MFGSKVIRQRRFSYEETIIVGRAPKQTEIAEEQKNEQVLAKTKNSHFILVRAKC